MKRGLPCLLFLSVGVLVLTVFFPGMGTNDAAGQWYQAATGNLNDWHPVGMTLLQRLFCLAFPADARVAKAFAFTVFGCAAFWGALFVLLSSLVGTRERLGRYVLGFSLCYPLWIFSVIHDKDVLTAAVFFLYLVVLRKGGPSPSPRQWAALFALALVADNLRHTSLLSLGLLSAGFLAVVRYPAGDGGFRARARAIAALALVLGLVPVATRGLHHAFQVARGGNYANMYLAYDLVGTLSYARSTPDERAGLRTTALFGKEAMGQAVASYRCGGDANYLIFGNAMGYGGLLASNTVLPDLVQVAWRHPRAFLAHKACVLSGLFSISTLDETYFPAATDPFVAVLAHAPGALRLRADELIRGALASPWLSLPYRTWIWALLATALGLGLLVARGRATGDVASGVSLWWAALCFAIPYVLICPAGVWRYLLPAYVAWILATALFLGEAWRSLGRLYRARAPTPSGALSGAAS